MPHYVVLLNPSALPAKSRTVHADRWDEGEDGVVRFTRDDRTVYRVARCDLSDVAAFDTPLGASDHLDEVRATRAGAASIHVDEGTAAAPRGRRKGPRASSAGNVTEGLSIRIEER